MEHKLTGRDLIFETPDNYKEVDTTISDKSRWGTNETVVFSRNDGTYWAVDYSMVPEHGIQEAGNPYRVEPMEEVIRVWSTVSEDRG